MVERWAKNVTANTKVVTVNVIVVAETATAASGLEVVAVNLMMNEPPTEIVNEMKAPTRIESSC